jgi:hypothetical protein
LAPQPPPQQQQPAPPYQPPQPQHPPRPPPPPQQQQQQQQQHDGTDDATVTVSVTFGELSCSVELGADTATAASELMEALGRVLPSGFQEQLAACARGVQLVLVRTDGEREELSVSAVDAICDVRELHFVEVAAAPTPAAATPAAAYSPPRSGDASIALGTRRSPRQSTISELGGVTDAQVLSRELGVAATLYLGAEDVLRLRAALERHTEAPEALRRVLERLSSVPLTHELRGSTHINDAVDALRTHTDDGVRTLATRIMSAWERQLARESQPRSRSTQPSCRACSGRHVAHTCGKQKQKH